MPTISAPAADKITFRCDMCQIEMKRVTKSLKR
jgi:hypothetical protein